MNNLDKNIIDDTIKRIKTVLDEFGNEYACYTSSREVFVKDVEFIESYIHKLEKERENLEEEVEELRYGDDL